MISPSEKHPSHAPMVPHWRSSIAIRVVSLARNEDRSYLPPIRTYTECISFRCQRQQLEHAKLSWFPAVPEFRCLAIYQRQPDGGSAEVCSMAPGQRLRADECRVFGLFFGRGRRPGGRSGGKTLRQASVKQPATGTYVEPIGDSGALSGAVAEALRSH